MMYIDDFIWMPSIIEKLLIKHHVTQDEVEEVFFDTPQYHYIESGYREGENVYAVFGQTDSGRYLTVIFINKPGNLALIITARDMDKKERKNYER